MGDGDRGMGDPGGVPLGNDMVRGGYGGWLSGAIVVGTKRQPLGHTPPNDAYNDYFIPVDHFITPRVP